MDQQEKLELAANILRRGKALAPDRFPQVNPTVCEAWAGAVINRDLPPEVWRDAVDVWALELAGEKMITPRDLHEAVNIVLHRWESDWQKKQILRARRQRRQELHDAKLRQAALSRESQHRQITA